MNDGTTERATELLAPIAGFRNAILIVDEIVGIECRIEDVVVGIAVESVATALRKGIDHAPTGLTKFGFVTSAKLLPKFLHHILTELKRYAGAANLLLEEGVVVICAVNHVVVKISRHAVETDHTEVAIGRGARSQQDKVGKISAVERERFNSRFSMTLLSADCVR